MHKKLKGLHPREYEHLLDKKALDALEGTPGFETLVKKFWELGLERIFRIQYTGSNLKVTKTNFPKINKLFNETCEILYLSEKPDLYLSWQYNINAMATGIKRPMVILFSGCIDLLEDEELRFIIGHELGHIKSNHILYSQMASILPHIGNVIASATFGFGGLIATGVELALLNWQRMSEFTADRAGLLACQNADIATKTMMKMAGIPKKFYSDAIADEFIKQAKEFEGYNYDTLDKAAKYMSIMWSSHPWTVMRGAEFYKWIESGEYQTILNRKMDISEKPSLETGVSFCANCGGSIDENHEFCATCGYKFE